VLFLAKRVAPIGSTSHLVSTDANPAKRPSAKGNSELKIVKRNWPTRVEVRGASLGRGQDVHPLL
jgi:hypothetical protein